MAENNHANFGLCRELTNYVWRRVILLHMAEHILTLFGRPRARFQHSLVQTEIYDLVHEDVRSHREIDQWLAWSRVTAEHDHLIGSLETQRERPCATCSSKRHEVEMAILERLHLDIRVLVYNTCLVDFAHIEHLLRRPLIKIGKVRPPNFPILREIS